MIHELGVELGAALAAKGCPLKVIDGPEPTSTTTFARERIVLQHDDGETFTPARSQQQNPKRRMIRNIPCKLTIYAQSVSPGAFDWEHRIRAEHVLDLVLVALDKVTNARKNALTLKAGKFIFPTDLAASEKIGGAVYELAFSVERGVFDQTWAGDIRPTATAGDDGFTFTGSTKVSLAHGNGDPPETGCGG